MSAKNETLLGFPALNGNDAHAASLRFLDKAGLTVQTDLQGAVLWAELAEAERRANEYEEFDKPTQAEDVAALRSLRDGLKTAALAIEKISVSSAAQHALNDCRRCATRTDFEVTSMLRVARRAATVALARQMRGPLFTKSGETITGFIVGRLLPPIFERHLTAKATITAEEPGVAKLSPYAQFTIAFLEQTGRKRISAHGLKQARRRRQVIVG